MLLHITHSSFTFTGEKKGIAATENSEEKLFYFLACLLFSLFLSAHVKALVSLIISLPRITVIMLA